MIESQDTIGVDSISESAETWLLYAEMLGEGLTGLLAELPVDDWFDTEEGAPAMLQGARKVAVVSRRLRESVEAAVREHRTHRGQPS